MNELKASKNTESGLSWFAVYTKHQHEKKSSDLVSRKGIEVFLPVYQAVHRWKDRKKFLSLPLFPGYFFVRSGTENKIDILSTPGVFFIVENAGRACPIPLEEIEAVRRITESGATYAPHLYVQSGERVRIRTGALAGICGIFLKPKNKHRIVVSLELLKKSVAVEIDAEDVEKPPESSVDKSPSLKALSRRATAK